MRVGRRGRRLGLRARITLAFALGALLLSALLAGTTWGITRSQLLEVRERAATRQVFTNARLVRDGLRTAETPADVDVPSLLGALQTPTSARPILFLQGDWFPLSLDFGQESLPQSLRRTVQAGEAARMRYDLDGEAELAVGVPIPALDAAYFEIVSLDEVDDTLRSLGIILIGAAALTTLAGAALGWGVSRRALVPLAEVSAAAEAIAGGHLETRLEAPDDPDLGILTSSFNEMVEALQDRLERDARFASDVSHELRSPLMTLSASLAVIEGRRASLDDKAQAALDLLSADVSRFEQLVGNLLEISRLDAGAALLELDDVSIAELVRQAVAVTDQPDTPVHAEPEVEQLTIPVDKRRVERVLTNLLDNANKYAGGATRVSVEDHGETVWIAVEDAGPGVPPEDRDVVFDRFARGVGAGRREPDRGVGLGLSLVAEHTRLHGGRVWVEDRADGGPGARFVVELPTEIARPVAP